ncbi:MAG: DUF2490 domain-containing protein [Bacteroidia bacterium]|nr:DUF2490 domain-containing protein [Bacteroidia bacterium]
MRQITGTLAVAIWAVVMPVIGWGQSKTIVHSPHIWLAYMSSGKISENYSLWNDIHYVPHGFLIARTGITRDFDNISITGGYTFALLPTPKGYLGRMEHRPWGQIQVVHSVNKSFSIVNRVRYDARFKEVLINEKLSDGYMFVNRIRFMSGIRKAFPKTVFNQYTPFLSMTSEFMINFGKNVTFNTFDQNWFQTSMGLQRKNLAIQMGYMNIFAHTGVGQFSCGHTLMMWVTHRFSVEK